MTRPPVLNEPDAEQLAALELLSDAKTVLLTGHERPDGDCIGSQAALARVLAARGQRAFVLEPDPPDPRYVEVTAMADFRVDDGGALPEHDLIVMLDGGDLSRTGGLHKRLQASPMKKLVVDHHLHDGDVWWDAAYVDTRASATGVLVRRIAAHLGVPIDPSTARALFTTLVTDTGWFRYSNTDVETLELAAELVGTGVSPSEVFGEVFQRSKIDHPTTLAAALARTAYYADGRVALIDVPPHANGGPFDFDSDAALDILRAVESVEVALVLRALDPSRCKLSARSKGAFDVQKLCATFGGGGHMKASGATIEEGLAKAREALVQRTLTQLDKADGLSPKPGKADNEERGRAEGAG